MAGLKRAVHDQDRHPVANLAVSSAATYLRAGHGDKALAIGVESLSNTPLLLQRGSDRKINSLGLVDRLLLCGSVSNRGRANRRSARTARCTASTGRAPTTYQPYTTGLMR